MFLPTLAAELPNGWTVSESSMFVSPSGAEVRARVTAAPDGWVAGDLLARETAAIPAGASAEETPSTFRINGNRIVAAQREFKFRRDGVDVAGRIICAVDDGIAIIITASWPPTDTTAAAEVGQVAAGIRLLNRPTTTFGAETETTERSTTPRRIPPDASAWADVRASWAVPIEGETRLSNVTRWSPQELAACALTLGAPSFPTVGVEEFVGLPRLAQQVTLETVMRSFVARGIVRACDDGSVSLRDDLRATMETAVFPDLTVMAQRVGADGLTVAWFGVRADRAVYVGVNRDGSRECGDFAPAHLLGQIWELSGIAGQVAETSRTDDGPHTVTLDEVVEQRCGVASLMEISTAWRVADSLRGGVLAWAVGTKGELWLADHHDLPTDGAVSWELRSSDFVAVRNELLDHLPGA